uniref:Uncharacterized protein n=1 Tax=Panagrolaimus sp. PS1159 TaxID=55785 RepID=A0AC35FFF5_9BILA
MIFLGIGIGIYFQRMFHILEDASPPPSEPVKIKAKKTLREIVSSDKLQPLSNSDKTSDRKKLRKKSGSIRSRKVSKSASPALSPANRSSRSKTSEKSILSSPADVSMSNVSPKTSESSPMASTQNVTPAAAESVDPLVAMASKIEKIVSPRKAVIRPSQVICDCGVECMDNQEKYSEETTMPDLKHPIIFTNKTKILPMIYDRYRPLNLIHPSENPTQISPFATMKPDEKEEATLLTPFKPILHSMYYAHRHALLIGDLLENYDHLED